MRQLQLSSSTFSIYQNHFGLGLFLDPFDELCEQSIGEDVFLSLGMGPAKDEVIGFKITAQASDLVSNVALAYHSLGRDTLRAGQ